MYPRPQFRRPEWTNLNGEWAFDAGDSRSLTLQPGLKILQSACTTDYTVTMAGGVIASILVLILYMFSHRYIIQGVSRSGVKG